MPKISVDIFDGELVFRFKNKLTIYGISDAKKVVDLADFTDIKNVTIDLMELLSLDSAASVYLNNLSTKLLHQNIEVRFLCQNKEILDMLSLVKNQNKTVKKSTFTKKTYLEKFGKDSYENYLGFLSFIAFLGELFSHKFSYLMKIKNIRFKEIAFEINESGIKALGIVSVTSFLIGVVVAYQSAYQLRTYGANIFIVDMMGLLVLRELSPVITAIVIAGRSSSAFTAQIGAMKITQELDAMQTMGFDLHRFLFMPRIIALVITLPMLIFVSDIMAILGGIVVAKTNLNISATLFIDRFHDVIKAKHFFIGITKGIFFAFLIATIGIYRGLMVKDDTQSIGFNTTKSVVEAIFAVIICDAVFSIFFTKLGI